MGIKIKCERCWDTGFMNSPQRRIGPCEVDLLLRQRPCECGLGRRRWLEQNDVEHQHAQANLMPRLI